MWSGARWEGAGGWWEAIALQIICAVGLLLSDFVTIPLWPSDPAKPGVTVPVSHLHVHARVSVIRDDGETAA